MSFLTRLLPWRRRKRRVRSPSEPCRVFISYNTHQREDRTLAKGLRRCLVDCEIDAVFRDEEDLKPGDVWNEVIDQEIERCSHLVVFITEATEQSDEVRREVDLALELEAKILPVIIGDPRNNLVSQAHAIRLTQARYIESISEDIEEICDKVAEATGATKRAGSVAKPIGRTVPLLCNRSTEEGRLRGALAAHIAEKRNQPAAIFVCGSEDDRPDSFITRILDTLIRKWIVDSDTAAVEPTKVEWPEGVAAHSMVAGLKLQLLQELGLPADDVSDARFIESVRGLPRKGLVIVHSLRCESWDPDETTAALGNYFGLWEQIGAADEKPFVVLIFKVLYSDVVRNVQSDSGAGRVRGALLAALKPWTKGKANVSAIMPADLPPVRREHVEEWFGTYAPRVSAEERDAVLNRLFATEKERRMSAVEPELRRFAVS